MLGSHVFPWRQTFKQTRRLASARKAPLQQFKRCMGIDFLRIGSTPTRCARSTIFSVKAESPTLPCRDDVLIDNGAAAPKSCLSLLEMHSPTAAGGLLSTDEASTTTRITFYQPRLRFCQTEEKNSERASTQSASYDSSFWRNNLLTAPSWWKAIETKSGQNLVFNPGGFTGVFAPARFWEGGARCFVGRFFIWAPGGTRGCSVFLAVGGLGVILQEWYRRIVYAIRIAVDRFFPAVKLV